MVLKIFLPTKLPVHSCPNLEKCWQQFTINSEPGHCKHAQWLNSPGLLHAVWNESSEPFKHVFIRHEIHYQNPINVPSPYLQSQHSGNKLGHPYKTKYKLEILLNNLNIFLLKSLTALFVIIDIWRQTPYTK